MSFFPNSQQGAGNLPVSATQPDGTYYIQQGLPNQLPFQIPYQPKTPAQQELLQPAVGLFVQQLQDNAGRNGARTFAFNMLSQNGYQNGEFTAAVESVVEYAEMLVQAMQYPPNEAIQQASKEIAQILSCLYVTKFPQLEQMLPPGGMNQISQDLQRGQDIQAAVEQNRRTQSAGGGNYMNHPRAQQQQWGGPQQNNQMQWGGPQPQQPQQQYTQSVWGGGQPQGRPMPQQQGGPFGVPGGGNPVQPQNQGNMGMQGTGGGMFQEQAPQQPNSQGMGGMRRSSLTTRKHPAVAQSMDDQGYQNHQNPGNAQQDFQNAQQFNGNYTHQPVPQQPQQPQQPNAWSNRNFNQVEMETGPAENFDDQPFPNADAPVSPAQAVPNEERPWDYIVDPKTGSEMVPAHLSNWERTWSIDRPHPLAYDHTTHVKFHIRNANGVVIEDVVPKEPSMDYLTHETDHRLKGGLPLRQGEEKVVPLDELLGKAEDVKEAVVLKDDLDEEGLKDIKATKKPLVIPGPFFATSGFEAECLVNDQLVKEDLVEESNKRPLQYDFVQVVPFSNKELKAKDGDKSRDTDLEQILQTLLKLESVNQYHGYLKQLNEKTTVPRQAINFLNENSTRAVNEALQAGLGLTWKIGSFLDDWEELMETFVIKHGDEQGPALRNLMLARYGQRIIGGGYRVLSGEDYDKTFSDEGPFQHLSAHRSGVIVLGLRQAVVTVPFSARQVSIDETPGNIYDLNESKLPNLHQAVKTFKDYLSEDFYNKGARKSIRTQERLSIELLEGAYNTQHTVLKVNGAEGLSFC